MNAKARLVWIRLYEELGDFGAVCRRCGISRPTLRKWWNRYQSSGVEGLKDHSKARLQPQTRKISSELHELILSMRKERNLGARRIRAELLRHRQFSLSTASISKLLTEAGVKPLQRDSSGPTFRRYSRPIPGERVQMDTCKIAPGVYQITAIDDCTRLRVLGIYPRRTAGNSVHFLENRMLDEFPFPIQRIQTDRGAEFFGLAFQNAMKRNCIKFRPIRPRSPHLNGKVERSQATDKIEIYPTVDVNSPLLANMVEEWQFDYDWNRPHNSIGGRTPIERVCELSEQTPLSEEVVSA